MRKKFQIPLLKMENYAVKGDITEDVFVCGSNVENDCATSKVTSDQGFTYSTPYISRKVDQVQHSSRLTDPLSYSVDSGFSDRTFDSTWTPSTKDTPVIGVLPSPISEVGSNRRQTLTNSRSSPVNRWSLSSCSGKKLHFTDFVLQPFNPHLSSPELCLQDESCNNDSEGVVQEKQAENVLLTNLLPTHCKYENWSGFISECVDNLEVNLQEMSLEEISCASLRTSPVQFHVSDLNNDGVNIKTSLVSPEAEVVLSQHEECDQPVSGPSIDTDLEISNSLGSSHTEEGLFNLCSPPSSRHAESHQSLDTGATLNQCRDTKEDFLNQLSLAPTNFRKSAHSLPINVLRNKKCRKPRSEDSAEKFSSITASSTQPPFPECSDCRVPPLPHEYSLTQNIAFSSHSVPHSNSLASNASIRSPSKRGGSEEDCSLIFSPTKVRRMDTEYLEMKTAVTKSYKQNLHSQILTADNQCSALVTHRTQAEHLQQHSSSLHSPVWSSLESGFHEGPKGVSDFKYLLSSSKSCDMIEKKTVPKKIFNNKEHNPESLQKFLEKFSPSDPARLIGRNVGLRKFDIVQGLHSRNLHLCLEKIFQSLTDADLISVSMVSTAWKLAMFSDHKTYNRYRQCRKTSSRALLQHGQGKENCGMKAVDTPPRQLLTAPRCLLSSVQSQAKSNVVPEPASTTSAAKDTLMCGDTLRPCPRCQGPAVIKLNQDRATCMNDKCSYDFCTLCFSSFHHPQPCKPLCKATSKGDVAGTKKSKKNLKRL